VVTTTLVGVATDSVVSDGPEAVVGGSYLRRLIRSDLETRTGANEAQSKLTRYPEYRGLETPLQLIWTVLSSAF
jgi:hypothetical protein